MIPILEFNIRNQTLSRIDSFRPAEKSVGYLRAKFNLLTDEWKNGSLKVRAKNRADQIVYEQEIVDGSCLIPWEALAKSGMFSVSVFCQNDDTEITTNAVDIGLSATLPGGSETNPPTPTELDEIREDIEQLREQVGTASVAPSDWLVNNETEPGYVKNRTHWVEKKFEPFGFDNGVIPDEYQIVLSALGEGIAYRISDKYLTKEQLDGATCYAQPFSGSGNDGSITYEFTSENGAEAFSFYTSRPAAKEDLVYGYLISAKEAGPDSITVDGYVVPLEIPAAGVYIAMHGNRLLRFTVYNETYEKLNSNFLPAYSVPIVDLSVESGGIQVPIGSTATIAITDKAMLWIQSGFVNVILDVEDIGSVNVAAFFSCNLGICSSRIYALLDNKWCVVTMTLSGNRLTILVTEE